MDGFTACPPSSIPPSVMQAVTTLWSRSHRLFFQPLIQIYDVLRGQETRDLFQQQSIHHVVVLCVGIVAQGNEQLLSRLQYVNDVARTHFVSHFNRIEFTLRRRNGLLTLCYH